ncbi:hydroxyacylglutathione hydrolase [Shewanella dokdonensis]
MEYPATQHQHFAVFPIAAFNDNYIWCIQPESSDQVWVVDPGDAAPVIAALTQKKLRLAGILITHHHRDHTGGIDALLRHFGKQTPVYGPDNTAIHGISHPLTKQGDYRLTAGHTTLSLQLYAVPGHTLDHIAYLIDDALFCGDTLFCAGCGRLFEGSAEQLYQSLQKIAQLPQDTKIYPAHEYTLSNLKFAAMAEPDNQALASFTEQAKQLRQQQRPTLPSSVARELAINPFLHCDDARLAPILSQHWQTAADSAVTRLKLLRQWKDNC